MTLEEYLADRAKVPGRWGECDCALFLADWVKIRTGKDPAKSFRGRYDTALAARRALELFGGPAELYGRQLARIGCLPTDDPRPGDVGVVPGDPDSSFIDPRHRVVGAIRVEGGWVTKAREAGINFARVDHVAAWRVP